MKKTKQVISFILAAVLLFTSVPAAAFEPPSKAEASLENGYASSPDAYAIYPVPQHIDYGGGSFSLASNVQVVSESGIDDATNAFLDEILENYGRTKSVSAKIGSGSQILLGIYESGGAVDSWVYNQAVLSDAELFGKTDAYLLTANAGTIAILGRDTNAVYHGLATLQMMFSSFAGNKFLNAQIEDYAGMKMRGFIEGFYGGWDYEGRESLMRFARDVKMNTYIYASKTDSYHMNDTLYPADDIESIEKLVRIGEETKVRYCWSVHISYFFNRLSGNAVGSAAYNTAFNQNFDRLTAKFQQLYDAGVRKFAILNDDFGSGSHTEVVRLLNKLDDEFLVPKGCDNLTYCMQGYNKAWSNTSELTALQGLNDSIDLFWTGDDVNSPITQDTINYVKEKTNHEAVFWLNYPVNEHAKSGIYLGNITHYARDGVTGLAGAVSNPCLYTEANKVGLFQLASLFWNNHNYQAQANMIWEEAFKYLQPEAYDAYLTIARNVSNCPGSGRIPAGFPESEYLAEAIASVSAKLGQDQPIASDASAIFLKEECDHILSSIAAFREQCANKTLITELDPWLNSLRDVAAAAGSALKAIFDMEKGDVNGAWSALAAAGEAMATQGTYDSLPSNPSLPKALAGSKRLVPFANSMISAAREKLIPFINPTPSKPVSEYGLYASEGVSGTVTAENLTYRLNSAGSTTLPAGGYTGIKLKELCGLKNVTLEADGASGLTLQYSLNGFVWNDMPQTPDGEAARYVRLYNGTNGNISFTLTELSVAVYAGAVNPYVSDYSAELSTLNANSGPWTSIFDGDLSTFVWTNTAQKTGQYIIVDFGAEVPVYNLDIIQQKGNPKFYNAQFYLSTDKTNWGSPIMSVAEVNGSVTGEHRTEEGDFIHIGRDDLDGVSARYLKIQVTKDSGYFIRINEITVNKDIASSDSPVRRIFTNINSGNPEKIIDGDISTLFSSETASDGTAYITYPLTENNRLSFVTFLQNASSVSNAAVTAEIFKDGQTTEKALGLLDQGINLFNLADEGDVLSFTVTWPKGAVPALYEIIPVTYTEGWTQKAMSVTVTPDTASLKAGGTLQLTHTVLPLHTTDKTVTWSSDNPSVANVDQTGLVTALAAGKTVITATAADGSGARGDCEITVTKDAVIPSVIRVASVTVTPNTASLKVGASQTLTASVAPANASNKALIWSSGNPAVATVNASGIVTAVTPGTAVITAAAADGSGKLGTCTVTVIPDIAPVQKGQTYEDKNYRYKVTDPAALTVEITKATNAKLTKIAVPDTVSVNGIKYKVTSIAASAFKNNKKATSATVGKNVAAIGKNAFAGCAKLTKVTLKSTVLKKIDSGAFSKCGKLKTITIKSKVLKTVGKNAFKGIHKKAQIKVPAGKLKDYKKLLAKKGQAGTVKIKK